MREIVIKLVVSDNQAALFADKDMMVTPLSEFEVDQFALALHALAETQELTMRSLRTLAEVVETKGAATADILKTVAMLLEPNRLAAEQVEYVRVILGRSARVGRGGDQKKERLQ